MVQYERRREIADESRYARIAMISLRRAIIPLCAGIDANRMPFPSGNSLRLKRQTTPRYVIALAYSLRVVNKLYKENGIFITISTSYNVNTGGQTPPPKLYNIILIPIPHPSSGPVNVKKACRPKRFPNW